MLSPPTGFNLLVFGNRFDAVFPSRQPDTFTRFELGGILTASSHNVSDTVKEHGASADVTFSYGLPGKPGYHYTRPFDYFDFHVTAVTANAFESINSRGLLLGREYAGGDTTRGVWGVYGSYDYISPQVFRVSSSALSLGTTCQTWLTRTVALQATGLGGVGYRAAGSIRHTGRPGLPLWGHPQALLALRLILADRAMVDLTGREYYVSGLDSTEHRGRRESSARRWIVYAPPLRSPRSGTSIRPLAPRCPLSGYCVQKSDGRDHQPHVWVPRQHRVRGRGVALTVTTRRRHGRFGPVDRRLEAHGEIGARQCGPVGNHTVACKVGEKG